MRADEAKGKHEIRGFIVLCDVSSIIRNGANERINMRVNPRWLIVPVFIDLYFTVLLLFVRRDGKIGRHGSFAGTLGAVFFFNLFSSTVKPFSMV